MRQKKIVTKLLCFIDICWRRQLLQFFWHRLRENSCLPVYKHNPDLCLSFWEQTLQTGARPSLSEIRFTNKKQQCSDTTENSERVTNTSEKTMMIFNNVFLVRIFGKINNSRRLTLLPWNILQKNPISSITLQSQYRQIQQIFIKSFGSFLSAERAVEIRCFTGLSWNPF